MKYKLSYARKKTIYEINCNASNSIEKLFNNSSSYKKALLVTDRNIYKLYKDKILCYKNLFDGFYCIILNAGEKTKSKNTVEKIYNALINNSFNRSDFVIALGGGVIGDICGFVSSTYMRGINLISIPTTLLSQVDACVGGKTGYNYLGKKNIIGSFYSPSYLIIDPLFIKTLDERQLQNGISEIIKYALISDKKLYNILSSATLKDFQTNEKLLLNVIKKCIKTKLKYVKKDPVDNTIRMKLNFGHTLGHAIESLGEFKKYSHGEAVAIGMCMITKQSDKKCGTNLYPIVKNILKSFKLPSTCIFTTDEIIPLIKYDKKSSEKKINIVILNEIGKAIIINETLDFFK